MTQRPFDRRIGEGEPFRLSTAPHRALAAVLAADNVTAIRAARMIDARGDNVISPAVMVVRGNKIESAGSVEFNVQNLSVAPEEVRRNHDPS